MRYDCSMRKTFSAAFIIAFSVAGICALPVHAQTPDFKNSKQAEPQQAPSSLPGVKPAKPIVSAPEPEPQEDHLRANPDGSFMINNTRVKISGSVIVDVGTQPSGRN